MVGIPQPFFDWGDNIPDFLVKLRLYLQNQGVDLANNTGGPPTGREVAIGYLRGCMKGRALEWFDEEITTKQNWELANLLDNTGQANLVAALGQPGTAIVKLRAVEGPWDEDWRIAGGRPTNIAVNVPNANNGTTVVVAGIRFGQAIYGVMTIDELYRKLLRIGRRANYRPEELRKKFLDALPLPWLEKAEDIWEHLPIDELAKKLYEIELHQIARHKRDRIPNPLQKTEYQSLLKKQKADYQLQIAQQAVAQKAQAPAPQIVEPVEQPRAEYLKELDLFNKNDLDSAYSVKPFQRPHPQRNEISARIDRIENAINKDRDAVNQLTNQFQKPLTPINFQNIPPDLDNEEDGYDEENNRWTGYDSPLIPKLSPAMLISEPFLDPGSEFGGINNPAIKALGWKANKPSDFAIKGNSKHITDSLEWYTDMPVTMKDEEGKTVTVIRNFVRIDNGEPEPMLFLGISNIRKLQGVPEPNKNQFCIKLHGKTYVIPTYSKAPVAKELPKEEQSQVSDSSSLTSENDLKKSA
ncbi:hypothetical protein C2G38_2192589 [Gigaspora rosea]|uniref:Uncharacterized protein n=1 Tax=Gigaspora rosea TaxID=44941 RepID=A0A397V0D7_9GLOM|nr:hypothetical protein C2G38_2192589 [Gigaspora rosea]